MRCGWSSAPPGEALLASELLLGRVAELADAQDSGSCPGNRVGVQLPPRPLQEPWHEALSSRRGGLTRADADRTCSGVTTGPSGWTGKPKRLSDGERHARFESAY